MDGQQGNTATGRWTCQACGCNTNPSSDRSCSVCGTSDGASLLRRSGYVARAGLFARNVAARRAYMEDELGFDDDDPLDRVEDVDMAVDDEDDVVAALAMEVAGVPNVGGRFQESRRQRLLDAARSFGMLSTEFQQQRVNPDDLLRAATENAASYQPKWAAPSQIMGRARTGTVMVVGDGERQNVAHLPVGAGEGRALRAVDPLPRGTPFSSFSLSPTGNPSSTDRRQRRAFGFRVAFDHPRREQGRSMGGCYLVGVTIASFNSFGERNALQQSPFFWGIEDGGSKFEGSRHASARGARRGPSHYAVGVLPSEAPRTSDNVLFGNRDVVSVVIDFETRSLTFWRNETLLGTLVTNLPRGGNIFPVVVPFNTGVTVAITGMNADPIPLLQTFASDWRQAQKEKDDLHRRKLVEQRAILIQNRRPTEELLAVLKDIFSSYATNENDQLSGSLPFVAAASLWYRCGMKLSCLRSLMESKPGAQSTNSQVHFDDFVALVVRVIEDEEESSSARGSFELSERSDICKVGDKVELAEGYERFGDASSGPLQPGNRGTVVEVQQGPNGERHSVRVLFNGRRWWYQPQALLSESSGLAESPAVWFLRTILRAHSYDHTTLQPLWGKPLVATSWQVGDIVAPQTDTSIVDPIAHPIIGRIVAETVSNSPLATRSRDAGSVLVEFVDKSFGEITGVLSGEPVVNEGSATLYTRRVRLNRLVHSRCVVAQTSDDRDRHYSDVDSIKMESSAMGSTRNQKHRPIGVICSKLRNLMDGVAELDVSAIEKLHAEFRQNAAALASSFAGGLSETFTAAFDKCEEQLSKSQDSRTTLAPALTALGDLAIFMANHIFQENGCTMHRAAEASERSSQDTLESSQLVDPSVGSTMRPTYQELDQGRGQLVGSTSSLGTHPAAINEMNNASRGNSLQQRRSMLLALVSRARRSGGGSNDERAVMARLGRDASAAPDHNLGEVSPFAFGGLGGLENHWDDFGRMPRAGGPSENSSMPDSFSNDPSSSLANVMPGSRAHEAPEHLLDSIVRGQGEALSGPRNATAKVSTSATIRSLIMNGLLGNSILWVQAAVGAQSERNAVGSSNLEKIVLLQGAVDDEGTPLLMLAISLGCSEPIIRFLISQGSPVTEKELKTAAMTDQPQILSVLLDHCVYLPGTIDHGLCSPAVTRVLEAAVIGQIELESRMREQAEEFFPYILNRLLQIGLSLRRLPSTNAEMSGRSITHALVGNVLLNALHEHQLKAEKLQKSGALESNASIQANRADSDRFQNVGHSQGFETSPGLLQAIPSSMFKKALFQHPGGATSPLVTFLLVIEDHLCNQGNDNAGAGLALFSTLLKHFPFLATTALIDRFGFAELISFHESYAVNRLTQFSSQTSTLPGMSRSDNARHSLLDGQPGAIRCGRNHCATIHITRHSSFRCDICGKAVERGRPMHGCRECDWDACEQCTDKKEGGIVKWLKVKEMALECQKLLLADDELLSGENFFSKVEKALSAIDQNCWDDHSSELNALSTRLLQRDAGALRHLSTMLETPGCITAHQFVTIILPSLHASLAGGRSEIGRPQGFGPRCKKARVVFPGRDTVEACPTTFGSGNRQFCKLAFEYLVVDDPKTNSEAADQGSNTADCENTGEPLRDEDNDDEDEDSDDETKEQKSVEKKQPQEFVPELVRRLHQILSFYEAVSVFKAMPAGNPSSTRGGSNGADLQALTQPLELTFVPSIFGRRSVDRPLRPLSIFVEPLTKMSALEKLILSTFRIVNPSYVDFCRRLAVDKAIIAEKPSFSSLGTNWKLGRIESYDEEIGAHRIAYASGLLSENDMGAAILGLKVESIAQNVAFECGVKSIILAAREFVVLHRQPSGEEFFEKTAVLDAESVLSDCGSSDVDGMFLTMSDASFVGARVESTTGYDGSWMPYTVVSVSTGNPSGHVLSENPRFTLISDNGTVHYDVPLNQIRGLEVSSAERSPAQAVRERMERAFGAESVFENRTALSRAFPFVSGRRENTDARRLSHGNETMKAGVLKRTWSALSSVEAMSPLELNLCGDESRSRVTTQLRCVIGERKADIFATERDPIEFAPIIRVCFSASDTLPTTDVTGETTLIASLRQLCMRDERTRDQAILVGQPYRMFFSIKIVPKRDRWSFNQSLESLYVAPVTREPLVISTKNSAPVCLEPNINSWTVPNRSRKLSLSNIRNDDDISYSDRLCEGLDEICVQCMDIISLLAECADDGFTNEGQARRRTVFESVELTQKLMEQLEDPLAVVGGALPDWCTAAPSYAPRIFSYESRKLLLERAAFGVSRSALRQQEAKVNVGPLRKRMAALRGRAVELVGEAFSGGAEDPTALQLQADELYGMEEALAARVKAAFRAQRWDERALQVAKAAVRRELLLLDAAAVMAGYANDPNVCRRRLEVRFDGESGFDAASGDEAGVTRGFYADVAEALLSCDHVAGAFCNNVCPSLPLPNIMAEVPLVAFKESSKLPLWIPDVDASGQVVIPTPRADPNSGLGVYPRPLSGNHPQIKDVLIQFRFIGRLFAAAMRDGFMFPVPLSAAFLKLIQQAGIQSLPSVGQMVPTSHRVPSYELAPSHVNQHISEESDDCLHTFTREITLSSSDLPRPGFLGGEVFAVEMNICRALDDIDNHDPPLNGPEIEKRYRSLASDPHFARAALGKSYDCSFEDYFQDRTFVDPLDPSQGEFAAPLCHKGYTIPVTISNIREWVSYAKQFILHDGVMAQARAFREGVEDFFPSEFLRIFTPDELQRDVCGVGDNVDSWDEQSIRKLFKLDGGKGAAEALVAVAQIGGEGGVTLSRRFGPSSPTVAFLVKALLEASPCQRRQFLSFVTSVPIVTPGLIEIVPMVAPTGEFLPMRDPGCLPRANTCARRLYLPKFESSETFAEVLWAVVREECKFKGFYEWRG